MTGINVRSFSNSFMYSVILSIFDDLQELFIEIQAAETIKLC